MPLVGVVTEPAAARARVGGLGQVRGVGFEEEDAVGGKGVRGPETMMGEGREQRLQGWGSHSRGGEGRQQEENCLLPSLHCFPCSHCLPTTCHHLFFLQPVPLIPLPTPNSHCCSPTTAFPDEVVGRNFKVILQ